MPNLWLFNPENDLALAAGVPCYTPPKSVAAFRNVLAALPIWMAEPGDNIIAPGVDERWLMSTRLGVGLKTDGIPRPWGWSADAVRQFRSIGNTGPFPDTEKLRELSHRRTAQKLYDLLPTQDYPRPLEITDVNELPERNTIMLKAPWSCSGRGVVDCTGMKRETIRERAAGIIRRQGSVMVEEKLAKVRDFAMLFESQSGIVNYLGLSLFFNSTSTAYGGNIVAPEEELAAALDIKGLTETANAVAKALSEIVGNSYEGPLGVDMMIYGPDRKICPTVEVNLRYTMGFVALALQRRFRRGLFTVTPATAIFRCDDGSIIKLIP